MKNLFSKVQPGDEIITRGGHTVKMLKTIKTATRSITVAFYKLEDGSTLLIHYDLNGEVVRKFHPKFQKVADDHELGFSHIVEKTLITKIKNFFKL